jgi:large subunit ribosomal protein L31
MMKKGIHPKFDLVIAKCACGASFETASTSSSIPVETCSSCNAFYTGRQKADVVGGRVDRFNKRLSLKTD